MLSFLPSFAASAEVAPMASAPAVAPDSPSRTELRTEAVRQILSRQTTDGAILMHPPSSGKPGRVVPYFSSLAAIALAETDLPTSRSQRLQAVRRWLHWYADHMNADGTVFDHEETSADLTPTGKYDSTDSYAATFLIALEAYHRASGDSETVRQLADAAHKAVDAIELTLQADSLTLATPTWRLKYLMDNVEVWRGFHSAASLARRFGRDDLAAPLSTSASAVLQAIEEKLWMEEASHYAWVMDEKGTLQTGLDQWYPHQMAQLMAVAWLPSSPRRQQLFATLRSTHFDKATSPSLSPLEQVDGLNWWGVAARTTGDQKLLREIQTRIHRLRAPFLQLASPADYAHLLHILDAPPESASPHHAGER